MPEDASHVAKESRQGEQAPEGSVPKTGRGPVAKKHRASDVSVGRTTRRMFVWVSVFGFIGACMLATVRFFFPRALFEPKSRFVIGYPFDFGFGVSTMFQQSHSIRVVRYLNFFDRAEAEVQQRLQEAGNRQE